MDINPTHEDEKEIKEQLGGISITINLSPDKSPSISIAASEGVDPFPAAVKAMEVLKKHFPFNPPVSAVASVMSGGAEEAPTCGVHKVLMVRRPGGFSKTSGKRYPPFWACPIKGEDGSYCRYKAPPGGNQS